MLYKIQQFLLLQVIMLPRCEMFKELIFMPRLIAFNETFVPLGKSQYTPHACVWHEAVSGRSKDDIISTFYNFLLTARDVENVTIWLDNCSAQNKNWSLFSFFIYLINSAEVNLTVLTLKYFQSGHTFMSSDAFHHQVEMSLKRKKKVYDFQDFLECVRTANSKKIIAKEMKLSDFYKFSDYTSQYKLTKINPRPYLHDMVWVQFERGKRTLKYKSTFEDDCKELSFILAKYENGSLQSPSQKPKERGFPVQKKQAIIAKLEALNVPANRITFWRNLPESEQETDLDNA